MKVRQAIYCFSKRVPNEQIIIEAVHYTPCVERKGYLCSDIFQCMKWPIVIVLMSICILEHLSEFLLLLTVLKHFRVDCDRWVPEHCDGGGSERWVVGRGSRRWEKPRWARPRIRWRQPWWWPDWPAAWTAAWPHTAWPQDGSQAGGTNGRRDGRGEMIKDGNIYDDFALLVLFLFKPKIHNHNL